MALIYYERYGRQDHTCPNLLLGIRIGTELGLVFNESYRDAGRISADTMDKYWNEPYRGPRRLKQISWS